MGGVNNYVIAGLQVIKNTRQRWKTDS